jgi:hypothetical protein
MMMMITLITLPKWWWHHRHDIAIALGPYGAGAGSLLFAMIETYPCKMILSGWSSQPAVQLLHPPWIHLDESGFGSC